MIFDDIYQRLTTFADLVALTGDRWYPSLLPQGPVKNGCGAFQLISGPRDYTLDGASNVTARWQFSCYAKTMRDAKLIAAQVIESFAPVEENDLSALVEDERDLGFDSNLQAFRSDVDLMFIYPDGVTSNSSRFARLGSIGEASRHSPVEALDGVRTAFTFVGLPPSQDAYSLVLNGLQTTQGFTQSGEVVTLEGAPRVDDELYAYY